MMPHSHHSDRSIWPPLREKVHLSLYMVNCCGWRADKKTSCIKQGLRNNMLKISKKIGLWRGHAVKKRHFNALPFRKRNRGGKKHPAERNTPSSLGHPQIEALMRPVTLVGYVSSAGPRLNGPQIRALASPPFVPLSNALSYCISPVFLFCCLQLILSRAFMNNIASCHMGTWIGHSIGCGFLDRREIEIASSKKYTEEG